MSRPAASGYTVVLSEARTRARLENCDLPFVNAVLVAGDDDPVLAAGGLRYPLTVKADHDDLPHRARHGAVVNDLRSEHELEEACRDMARRLGGEFPGLRFMVQEYERDGTDLLMAGVRDPVFGDCLVVGAGGSRVEELRRVEYVFADDLCQGALRAALERVIGLAEPSVLDHADVLEPLDRIAGAIVSTLREDPSVVDLEFNPVRLSTFPRRRITILDALLTVRPDGDKADRAGGTPQAGVADGAVIDALQRALRAQRVAVVGVSRSGSGLGNRLLRHVREGGFEGEIVLVHPAGGTVEGLPAVAALPASPPPGCDVAFVLVAEDALPQTLQMLERAEVGLVVLMSSLDAHGGQGSVAARALQDTTAVVLGPNTAGMLSSPARLRGSFVGTVAMQTEDTGVIGLATQSGSIGSYLIGRCAEERIGVRYWLPTGNEAHIRLDHAIRAMIADSAVSVLGLFIEGVREGRALLDAVGEARRRGVTVVAHVTGSTSAGKEAARSHTAALAGDHGLLVTMLTRTGAIVVEDVDSLFDVLKLAATLGDRVPRDGDDVVVLGTSGASCTLVAEDFGKRSVALAPVSDSLRRHLRAVLPAHANVSNPLDVTADAVRRPELLIEVLRKWRRESPEAVFFLALGTQSGRTALETARSVVEHARDHKLRLVVSRLGPRSLSPEVLETYRHAGIAVYESPHRAARAIATALEVR